MLRPIVRDRQPAGGKGAKSGAAGPGRPPEAAPPLFFAKKTDFFALQFHFQSL